MLNLQIDQLYKFTTVCYTKTKKQGIFLFVCWKGYRHYQWRSKHTRKQSVAATLRLPLGYRIRRVKGRRRRRRRIRRDPKEGKIAASIQTIEGSECGLGGNGCPKFGSLARNLGSGWELSPPLKWRLAPTTSLP